MSSSPAEKANGVHGKKIDNKESSRQHVYLLLFVVIIVSASSFLPKELFLGIVNKIYDVWMEVPIALSTIAYWTFGVLYVLMDIYNKPAFLRKYKIQPGANEPVDPQKLKEAMIQVFINQTVVSIPFGLIFAGLQKYLGPTHELRALPSLHETALHILGCVIVEEFAFYYSHRLLHHPNFYKYIHKKHHEWTAPIAWVAIYAHPVEHILSNIFPLVLGTTICNCHPAIIWLWFFLATVFTMNEHSGYHLPFLPSAEAHDFHHFKFNNCYGVLGLLDYLHGTDKNFKAVQAGKRHRVLKDLRSARELYPDLKTT